MVWTAIWVSRAGSALLPPCLLASALAPRLPACTLRAGPTRPGSQRASRKHTKRDPGGGTAAAQRLGVLNRRVRLLQAGVTPAAGVRAHGRLPWRRGRAVALPRNRSLRESVPQAAYPVFKTGRPSRGRGRRRQQGRTTSEDRTSQGPFATVGAGGVQNVAQRCGATNSRVPRDTRSSPSARAWCSRPAASERCAGGRVRAHADPGCRAVLAGRWGGFSAVRV